jgi:cytidine deaminase
VAAAVAAGHRSFEAVAVAADGTEPASACGACRQVLREFPNGPDLRVLLVGESGDALVVTTLERLLPGGFGPERLAHRTGQDR